MAFGGRLGMAVVGAWEGLRAGWRGQDVTTAALADPIDWRSHLRELRGWHEGTLFTPAFGWGLYKARHRLARTTRLLYNPTPAIVGAYVSTIYPGLLPLTDRPIEAGIPVAAPLADETPPALRRAVQQAWRWSNWQANKSQFVQTGATFGSVLVEVVEDPERGKGWLQVRQPEEIAADPILDAAGNVRAYALEYRAADERGTYTYRKEVDRETIREYRDGTLIAETAHGYGFCPATWAQHRPAAGAWGEPAIGRGLPMLRSINSVMSQLDDANGRTAAAPKVIFGGGSLASLAAATATKRPGVDEYGPTRPDEDREQILTWTAPAGGTVASLSSPLDIAALSAYVKDVRIPQFEALFPELTYSRELRAMSTLTGPAAARLLADVGAIVYECQATYDRAHAAGLQMLVAILGERLNGGQGGWANANSQQRAFDGFDLASYDKGELDLTFLPRPLVGITAQERAQEVQTEASAVKAYTEAGLDLVDALVAVGWDEDKATAAANRQVDSIKRAQMLAQQDALPAGVSGQ